MMDEVFPYLAKCVGRVVLKKKTEFRAESDISRIICRVKGRRKLVVMWRLCRDDGLAKQPAAATDWAVLG